MLHAASYRPVGVPVVAVKNIGDNRLIDDGVPRVDTTTAARLDRYKLRAGDILFGRKGAVERRALVRRMEDGWLQGSDCIRLRFTSASILPEYVAYAFGTEEHRSWMLQHAHGATMPSLNQEIISRIPLRLPPIAEQRVVAEVLGALDEKIELNRRMTQTLLAIAKAIFTSQFVEGEDARSWPITTVAACCTSIYSGGTPDTRASEYWDGDVPWLSSGETREPFIIRTEKMITHAGVKNSSTRLAPAGATVIASAGQGHTRGQTSFLTFDCYINQSVIVLIADPAKISDIFLYFDLERRYQEFRRISDSSSSRGSLTTKLLGQIGTVLPPRPLILNFNDAVRPIVGKIECALRESQNLSDLRNLLLPRLLSGATSLNAAVQ